MKKIFTLMTLALMSIGSAWADELNDPFDLSTGDFNVDFSTWEVASISEKTFSQGIYFKVTCSIKSEKKDNVTQNRLYLEGSGNMTAARCIAIPLTGINGKITVTIDAPSDAKDLKLIVTEGSVDYTKNYSGTPEAYTYNSTTKQGTYTYTMTDSEKTDAVLFIGRAGSSRNMMNKINITTPKGTVTTNVTGVTINRTAISDADLTTLASTKALTDATAYEGLPIVKFTYTTTEGGVTSEPQTSTVVASASGENYEASLAAVGGNYTITFTGVTPTTALNVTDTKTVYLTQNDVAAQGYLTASSNWADQTIEGTADRYLNLAGDEGRYLTITPVSGALSFELYMFNPSSDRSVKIKIGTGDAIVYTVKSGLNSLGVLACSNSDETIKIMGNNQGVWPYKIIFYTTAPTVSITPAYDKSTYVTTSALDFSSVSGLKAYVATAAENGSVTLEEVGAVPSGTPLLLIGTAGTEYSVPVAASASAPATNLLKAGDGSTTFDGTSYDYLLFTDGLFYKITSGTVATNKAYLHCDSDPNPGTSRTLDLNIGGGGATGIETIKVGTDDNVYYDLQGRRVLYPTKGLYIVNGKKVIIK